MNAINIIIGAVILIVVVLVLMQPMIILTDVLNDVITNKNTTKYGTDSEGNIVEVGESFFGGNISIALVGAIGLAIFVGFIIWAGRGGNDPMDEMMQQGGI